jgi:RNA polymerase sigma factor (sigma-70 family)
MQREAAQGMCLPLLLTPYSLKNCDVACKLDGREVFSRQCFAKSLLLVLQNRNMNVAPTTRCSLIVRLKDRQDASAWEEFNQLYSPLIGRIARQRGIRDCDVSEIVQDVMLSIVKAIPNYERNDRNGSFRKWLITIAKNKSLNRLMRKPVEEHQRSHQHDVALVAESAPLHRGFNQDLEQEWQQQVFVLACEHVRQNVQPQTWSAFWMTAVELRNPPEVARELGLELGTVYVARSRVLAKIRTWVQNNARQWEET